MALLEIVHENNDFIVVNKAAGLITEKSPFESLTVENQVYDYIVKKKKKPYVGVVHRLDRVTSGVLVFAKKKSVLVAFNELFSSRRVQKTYLAVVSNKPPKTKQNLKDFLVKNRQEKRADIVPTKTKNAQDATLSYQILGQNKYGYLLEIKPKTGRFHQIRAQLSHIGCPIIGDEKYGSDKKYLNLSVCLHAWKLTYPNLNTKENKTVEASTPKNDFWDFKQSNKL